MAALALPPSLSAQSPLPVPPSLLAQGARAPAPGASSRLTAEGGPCAEAAAAGDGIFPELLAGLVAANGAAAGDGRAAASDGAPRPGTPAGIETLLPGTLPAQRGGAAEPADRLADRRAASREPSEAASRLAAGAMQSAPDPGGETISAIPMQPTAAIVEAGRNLPAPEESVALPGADGKPARTSASQLAPFGAAADRQISTGIEWSRRGAVSLAARQSTPMAAGDASSGQPTLQQAGRTAEPPALVLGQPGSPPPVTRRRSGDPDDAVPADEMRVRAGLAAPAAAASGSADLSGSPASRPQVSTPPSRRSSGSVVAQVLALSGQVPRTVDSMLPAAQAPPPVPASQAVKPPADAWPALEPRAPAPAEASQESPDESLIPAGDPQVRALETSTADRGAVAFALQVKATPTPASTAQHASPAGLPAAEGSEWTTMPAQPGGVPVPGPAAASGKGASQPEEPDHTPAGAGRERRPEVAPAGRAGPSTGPAAGKMDPPAFPDAQMRAETAPERTAATAAKAVRPQDAMESAPPPEAAKAPLVRDMKFEVTGGQQRVEVRLSERAGEVKMTVRTADEPLANTLRENLPALSARLAESGFKSEAWHPAASSTDELRHTVESGARGASHDTNQDTGAQPRQQDREPPDGAGQRRPKSPLEATSQKEKGKDFEWLMSSLR